MKALDLLRWIADNDVDGKNLTIIDVPAEPWQTEDWWTENVGGLPPHPVRAGRYMYFGSDEGVADVYDRHCAYVAPDFEVENGLGKCLFFYLIDE